MLFRSKKTKKSSPQRGTLKERRGFGRRCRLEPLEERRMLSAFNLADYGDPVVDTQLGGEACCSTVKEYSGITYSEVTDQIYIVDDETEAIIRYDVDGTAASRYTITTTGFDDLEGIVHMSGTTFAILEERDQTGSDEFHISIVDIQDNTTSINKSSLATAKILKMTHTDLNDDGGSFGLEGLAYDKTNGVFYVAKELENIQVFKVTDNGEGNTTVTKMQIDDVTDMDDPDLLKTISDIYFTDKAGANQDDERLFMMSSDTNSRKVIMADMDTSTKFDVVLDGEVPVQVDLETVKWEGLSFTPGGFIMFAVADEINGDSSSRWRFRIYRSFPSLTPAAAPDLDAASDTRVDDDNVTTDQTPTFSGTLTRGIFEDSVPVEDAWVWLYVDGVQTGSADQVGTGEFAGEYTLTAAAVDVDPGGRQLFTIKAGPSSSTPEAERSFASAGLLVTIALTDSIADLNIDGFVDFQDLTVLLANWNKNVTAAEGNLVDPTGSVVDFNDLTVLLAAWTGPRGASARPGPPAE